jgi:hypothetical protein
LRYRKSKGIARYGAHDEVQRTRGEWQSENIGALEFSPTDKLAEYGWKEFVDNPITAKYLGWPLHALGETVVPHHITGTMSHGHEAYERAIDDVYSEIKTGTKDEILEKGFAWWKKYCYQNEMKTISNMVVELATENRQMVTGDWAWKDDESFNYTMVNFVGALEGIMGTKDEIAARAYSEDPDFVTNVRPLFVNASGAALATLMCASQLVEPPGQSADTECPGNTIYCPTYDADFECIDESQCTLAEDPDELDIEVQTFAEEEEGPIIII